MCIELAKIIGTRLSEIDRMYFETGDLTMSDYIELTKPLHKALENLSAHIPKNPQAHHDGHHS